MAGKLKADKALNVGHHVELADGRKVLVRELTWKATKIRARDIYGIMVAIKEANPGVDFMDLSNEQMVEVAFASLPKVIDGIADMLGGIVADACDLGTAALDDLGLADFQKVLLGVLQEQGTAVDDFFGLRAVAVAMFKGPPVEDGKTKTLDSGKSIPSLPSSPTASRSQT